MTLNEFIDNWTMNHHTVYICQESYYEDMYELIDRINDGNKKITIIHDYIICTFIPSYSKFTPALYLKDTLAFATVEHYYIGKDYMIVWIKEKVQ